MQHAIGNNKYLMISIWTAFSHFCRRIYAKQCACNSRLRSVICPAPPARPLPVMIFLMVDTDWYGNEHTTPTHSIATALDPIPTNSPPLLSTSLGFCLSPHRYHPQSQMLNVLNVFVVIVGLNQGYYIFNFCCCCVYGSVADWLGR